MKTLENHLTEYYAYHRDFRNRATHFVGVPLVTYGILHFFGWFRFVGYEWFSFGFVFFIGCLIHYVKIDLKLAAMVLVLFAPLLALAEHFAQKTDGSSLPIFLATFFVGVALQLLGHKFEGRKPALVDNFFQIFNAPLLLVCELLFALGFRKDLERACLKL